MHIWLVTVGEPLPTDEGNERLLRAGILADMLSETGHRVVWWTSAFNHSLKISRATTNRHERIRSNYEIRMLYGGGYRRNISLQRLIDHRNLAREFQRESRDVEPPDAIVCSFPPIELSAEAIAYGVRNNVPVVLDVRDLWPDIFLDGVPRWTRPAGSLAIAALTRKVRRAFRGATAIWGHAPAFTEWGLNHAGRPATELDGVFPFGYVAAMPTARDLEDARAFWSSAGIVGGAGQFIACFVGTVGFQTDIEGLIKTARLLGPEAGIKIVVCGTGDRLVELREAATGVDSILFAGWRRRSEIWTLLRMASIGIAPYVERADFLSTIPNKVPEYLSAGLPIGVNLGHGRIADLLAENRCGFSYQCDPDLLAKQLVELRDTPERLALLRQRASALFDREFRAEHVYGRMIDQLASIVTTHRQQSLEPRQITGV